MGVISVPSELINLLPTNPVSLTAPTNIMKTKTLVSVKIVTPVVNSAMADMRKTVLNVTARVLKSTCC